ncbi:APG9-domain-containing protein [Nadsonia fulvescens var. elongata DSM 6958]|uniref:Autophagy-related protein 9 n=1 Tax=Nadsonia fulvescens var. elongata DSM 6958 TaxID=857566 RepID=A0A1E3PNR1_9ASCO|nr:APG9-domain-containing protein [Nadsonia fulvescens var. elongata DSM 6958]
MADTIFSRIFGSGSVYESLDNPNFSSEAPIDHPYYRGLEDDSLEGDFGLQHGLRYTPSVTEATVGESSHNNVHSNQQYNRVRAHTGIPFANGTNNNHYDNNYGESEEEDDEYDDKASASIMMESPGLDHAASSGGSYKKKPSPKKHFRPSHSPIPDEPEMDPVFAEYSVELDSRPQTTIPESTPRPSTGEIPRSWGKGKNKWNSSNFSPEISNDNQYTDSETNSNRNGYGNSKGHRFGERRSVNFGQDNQKPQPLKDMRFEMIDGTERALWKWANVENIDLFLHDVYSYFLGNGIYCILLSRALNMITVLFVVGFSTYLTSCINYPKIRHSHSLSEVQIPQCMAQMSSFHVFMLWVFYLFWFLKLFQYIKDIRRLIELQNFYHYLLEISENEMQTISWQQVVRRLMALREKNAVTATTKNRHTAFLGNQSKQKMEPQDIANRLMRKENYMIAMFNKDILNLTLPVPLLRSTPLVTRTLEWNLSLCIMDYAFDQQGQLRTIFLKESQRNKLVKGLRNRFLFAGIMNVIFAPFILIYLSLLYFFRYFNEYRSTPSTIGMRQYTLLAEWKMREFNELSHLFQRRLNLSYEFASQYVNQFPKEKTVQISRFIAFIAGSFAAILGIVSVIDPELFLGFEITKDRTVLFYIGIFGSILAVSRGLIPEETLVFDPEITLRYVAEYTHYLPSEWEGRLHSDTVKAEFSALYDLKLMILFRDLASVVITPFILWFSLPNCSEKIIDFFREFSVHVDGVGYICTFALFDFDANNNRLSQETAISDEVGISKDNYYTSNDGKMLKSYLNFMDNYADNGDGATNNGKAYGNASGFVSANGSAGGGTLSYMLSRTRRRGLNPPLETNLENSVMARYGRTVGNNTQYNVLSGSYLPSESIMANGHSNYPEISSPGLFQRKSSNGINGKNNPSIVLPSGHEYRNHQFSPDVNYGNLSESINNDALEDSFFAAAENKKVDNDDTRDEENETGVLGLLNQFYRKQTDI